VILNEMIQLFMDSRKRGTTGARAKCAPKTLRVYSDNLKSFEGFLMESAKDGPITKYEQLRRLHVMHYLDWMEEKRKKGEWAVSTVLQNLRTLRVFFRWVDADEDCQLADHKGMQKYLPVIGKNPRRVDIPQTVDLKKFKNAFNTSTRLGFRDYVATSLMLDTGIRVGELADLRVDHVFYEEKRIIVDGKTGPRVVSITIEMARLLKGWLRKREKFRYAANSPYVFISKYGEKMTPGGFAQKFHKHCAKFGLPRISPHTLRHAFATNYLKQGGNMEKLRLMTGHTSYAMLMDYLHLAELGGKSGQEELEKVSLLKQMAR